MSDATNTVGEAASDCLWTPLILISGSNSDSIFAQSELTHILPSDSSAPVIHTVKEKSTNNA